MINIHQIKHVHSEQKKKLQVFLLWLRRSICWLRRSCRYEKCLQVFLILVNNIVKYSYRELIWISESYVKYTYIVNPSTFSLIQADHKFNQDRCLLMLNTYCKIRFWMLWNGRWRILNRKGNSMGNFKRLSLRFYFLFCVYLMGFKTIFKG